MSKPQQRLVVHGSQKGFESEVNKLMAGGWRAVPGTTHFGSVRITANPNTPPQHVDHVGSTSRVIFSVVLEHDNPPAGMSPIATRDR